MLYSADIERTLAFYALLGLTFEREQHGRGPMHYAAPLGDMVLEIYPLAAGAIASGPLRLGFDVKQIEPLAEALIDAGGRVMSELQDLPLGRVIVVSDPDGRKMELVEPRGKKHCCG